MLANSSCALLVATLDAELVGYVTASIHPTLCANGPVGWIEEIMVDDSSREAGAGRLLVASVALDRALRRVSPEGRALRDRRS